MKHHLIISLLFISLGFSQKEYNYNDIINMDNGLWTEKFSDEPISGKVYGYFSEKSNPKKVYFGNLLNGGKKGRWTIWYQNGKKRSEETWKDGKRDGLVTDWYENGKKGYEGTWKDGKKDGLSTIWYQNGKKTFEGTWKNGKSDGLWTFWYENGNKSSKVTYKNGELFSEKCWDEDGNEKDCN